MDMGRRRRRRVFEKGQVQEEEQVQNWKMNRTKTGSEIKGATLLLIDIDDAFDEGDNVCADDDYLKEKSEAWKGCWITMLMFSLFQRGHRFASA